MKPGDMVTLQRVYNIKYGDLTIYDDPFDNFKSNLCQVISPNDTALVLRAEDKLNDRYGSMGTYVKLLTSKSAIGWINLLDIEVVM